MKALVDDILFRLRYLLAIAQPRRDPLVTILVVRRVVFRLLLHSAAPQHVIIVQTQRIRLS